MATKNRVDYDYTAGKVAQTGRKSNLSMFMIMLGILLGITHSRGRYAKRLAAFRDRLHISCHKTFPPSDTQTRLLLGGRHPLWGMGVTSLIMVTSSPAV